MSWQNLLSPEEPQALILPWAGGRVVHSTTRTWRIKGRRPPEHGWYEFTQVAGRKAQLVSEEPLPAEPDFAEGIKTLKGYLVGDRFIADGAAVSPDPDKLIEQTEPVYCVELGLERFTRAEVFRDREDRLIYLNSLWPKGPENEALEAYQDRLDSISHVKGATPALELAFHWITWGRERAEALAAEQERLRQEELARLEREERMRAALRDAGTGAGRRALARENFEAAARLALAVSGAELLDVRDSVNRGEKVVQYRFRHRRLECVCHAETLRIIDAGVCLDDHRGTKGDTYFTLESLPAVIGWVMDNHRLVVWRHVDGDEDERDWGDEWD